jgi:hypothetical protein
MLDANDPASLAVDGNDHYIANRYPRPMLTLGHLEK